MFFPFAMFLLKDYTPSLYNIQQTQLSFLLGLSETVVRAQLLLELPLANFDEMGVAPELILHGEDLTLIEIKIARVIGDKNWHDWHHLSTQIKSNQPNHLPVSNLDEFLGFENQNLMTLGFDDYYIDGHLLKIKPHALMKCLTDLPSEGLNDLQPPIQFIVQIKNKIAPIDNKTLMGMYASEQKIFTQCEAEGFRRITYYLDRPDQMSIFSVHIAADDSLPVLLSNGNLLASWLDTTTDRAIQHVLWHDPFKKPSYLFALVAGRLACLERRIQQNDEEKLLQIWVEPTDLHKIDHAMDSLQKSIEWDEKVYGLPLDLDRFMIVATHDFNMGAMENKGLNIFNAKYILAHPDMATDTDYFNVESIIAHEYFHNWTGNRITCRDWFQLTLKEGLTVFRDQSFSEDLQGPVSRLESIRFLKQAQFAEDRGPMAHPIQPQAYEEINNFYTLTVYEKGAEVIRMYQTMLGKSGFMAGMTLYFERHDGQAITCQDFLAAMRDANPNALTDEQWLGFLAWYTQKGTPLVTCESTDLPAVNFSIHLNQSIPNTSQSEDVATDLLEKALCIPIAIDIYLQTTHGVLKLNHSDILQSALPDHLNHIKTIDNRCLLLLNQISQTWSFNFEKIIHPQTGKHLKQADIEKIYVAYLQDFSAPVLLQEKIAIPTTFILKHEDNLYQKQQAFIALELQAAITLYQNVDHQILSSLPYPAVYDVFMQKFTHLSQTDVFREILQTYRQSIIELIDHSSVGDDFKAFIISGLDFETFKAALIQQQKSIKLDIQAAHHAYHIFKAIWLAEIYHHIDIENRHQIIAQKEPSSYAFAASNQRTLGYAYLKIQTYMQSRLNAQGFAKKLKAIYDNATHLSGRLAALQNLVLLANLQKYMPNNASINTDYAISEKAEALNHLITHFKHEPLVIDLWFKLQAQHHQNDAAAIAHIQELMKNPHFNDNPNRVRALLSTFCLQNPAFYSDAGLNIWAEAILRYDAQNPQLAARFVRMVDEWRHWNDRLQDLIAGKLNKLHDNAKSSDVLEVVRKALND
jgi:aminopeptidase N